MNPSPIIAGTMKWGVWGANFNTNQFARAIEAALAAGVTTFDHADIYGGYITESEFGAGFEASGLEGEAVQFISKCGIKYPPEGSAHAVKHYDYSESHIRQAVENSLRNLRTAYIDVYLLHRPSPLLDAQEAVTTLEFLRDEGKIKAWGVSNFTPSQLRLVATQQIPEWNQIECSLAHTTPLTDGTLDTHQTLGVRTMAWAPLGQLLDNNNPRVASVLNRLSTEYGVAPEVLLLMWLQKHPAGIIPVVGTTRSERYASLMQSAATEMKLEHWFELLEASWGQKVP
jgi:predicted oxidoreductase